MRILITGCGGMLGEAVYSELNGRHTVYATDIDCNEAWLHHLDVRAPADVRKWLDMTKPDAVLHLAAITDMEHCELNPTNAYDTNYMGTHNVVRALEKYGVPMVYISSAGVFDGSKMNYVEDDIPNPLNVYAKSKYAGELVAMSYPKSIIVRAGWMMGGGPLKDKKFVNKIVKQIRDGATELFVVKDKLGTPTYTYELAKTIHKLLQVRRYGILHGACDGGGNRVDVALEIVRNLGMEGKVKVNPVGTEYFSKTYFAKRPYSEKLVSSVLEPAKDWQTCLKDYLTERFDWGL